VSQNLFGDGLATSTDEDANRAALEHPGVLLRRPVANAGFEVEARGAPNLPAVDRTAVIFGTARPTIGIRRSFDLSSRKGLREALMTVDLLSVAVADAGSRIELSWRSGQVTSAPAPWLFDVAEGEEGHASGHRRRGGLETIACAVQAAELDGSDVILRFKSDAAVRRIPTAAFCSDLAPEVGDEIELWASAESLAGSRPIDFDAYLTDDGVLAQALQRVARLGIVFLAGAGERPLAVERAVARFGYIRETNYGRLFDVREEAAPSHLAYTAAGLELHTDNPYRDPEPTLQLLHVIEAADVGGESQFVDGFAQAEVLRREAPGRFRVLAATPVEFAFLGPAGERYAARAPVIEVAPDGRLKAMRVNHRALRPPALASGVVEAWYDAYLNLYQRLHAPAARLQRKLVPGDMVMFDNRRVLHGRSAYGGAGGRRWLQGCYAERDGLYATLSRLRGPTR
jgi:gamma-butyrobetaine dioxygenase